MCEVNTMGFSFSCVINYILLDLPLRDIFLNNIYVYPDFSSFFSRFGNICKIIFILFRRTLSKVTLEVLRLHLGILC